jgi:hypothetical protein
MNFLSYNGLEHGKLHSVIMTSGYAVSYVIYDSHKSVGSSWCIAAALSPFILITLYPRDYWKIKID